eukprot:EG_transcript_25105
MACYPRVNSPPHLVFCYHMYWASSTRAVEARDLGHTCRECKQKFNRLGETIVIRRGGRIEMRYHEACFSGDDDPRTQAHSSAQDRWDGHVSAAAPKEMFRKMRTASHF